MKVAELDIQRLARVEAPAPRLIYSPHPLLPAANRQMFDAHFLPGESIAQYLDRMGVQLRGPAVLAVNGIRLPREMWRYARPKPGTVITLRAAVAGGDGGSKDPMRMVLMIGLIVVSAGYGAALGEGLGFAAGSATAAAVGGAIISIGGNLIIGALLPPPKPQLTEAQGRNTNAASPTYSLSGGANRARLYEPLPLCLGEHRVFPDLGAKEYTEFQGEDQILFQCFNFGYGDLLLSDLRIGATPLSSYQEVQYEISKADGKLALFPFEVDTTAGASLTPHDWVTRTSSVGATGLAVEITGALYAVNDLGTIVTLGAYLRLEYRLSGATDWLPFANGTGTATHTYYWSAGYYVTYDDGDVGSVTYWAQVDFGGTDPGEHVAGATYAGSAVWRYRPYSEISSADENGDTVISQPAPPPTYSVLVPEVLISSTTTSPLRRTFWAGVPEGQYEVRVKRLTDAETQSNHISELVWSQLRSYRPDTADYTGQVRVAIKIRATGQLSGRIEQFSAMVSARCLAWDGSDWAQRETSNPAWLMLYVARGLTVNDTRVFGGGLADARIDIEGLKAFGAWCDQKALTFNAVLDRPMSCQDLLEAMARCGRGSVSWASGKLGVVWDAPDQAVSAVYGIGNILASSLRMDYITEKVADEIVLRFVNPDMDWQQDEVRALVPGVTTPTRSTTIDLWGCADLAMAGREANLIAADQYYHNARLSFEVDMEGFVNTRGDTILLAHDLMRSRWGYSGRLVESSTASVLKLGRKVTFTPGEDHYVLVKKPDGSYGIHPVVYQAGESDSITLATPLAFNPSADADGHPVYDYVWMFDLRATPGRRCKIIAIPSARQNRVQIVVVDDDPDYYENENETYTHVDVTAAGNDAPTISNLAVAEQLVRGGAGYVVRLTFTWDVAGRYDHARVRVGIDGEPLTLRAEPAGLRYDLDVPDGSTVEIEVTAIHPLGFKGSAAARTTLTYEVLGASASPPSDVAWFTIDGDRLAWVTVPELDVQFGGGYKIRFHYGVNRSFGDANDIPASGGLVTETPWRMPFKPEGQVTLMIVAVDAAGIESANAATIVTDLGDAIVNNIMETIDIEAAGFPGSILGGAVSGGDILADDASGRMWAENENTGMWTYDSLAMWHATVYETLHYLFTLTPSSAGADAGLTLDYDIVGDAYAIYYRRNAPQPMWSVDSEAMWSTDSGSPMWGTPEGTLPNATKMWSGDANLMWHTDSGLPMWVVNAGGYQTWPSKIDAFNEPFDFYITVAGGPTRGRINTLTATIDMPDIEEDFDDLVISAGGTRLPITLEYSSIKNVKLTVQADGFGAVGVRIIDKNADLGPLIKCVNDAGTYVAGLIDASIKGIGV